MPLTLIRSLKSLICGEVYSPTFSPDSIRIELAHRTSTTFAISPSHVYSVVTSADYPLPEHSSLNPGFMPILCLLNRLAIMSAFI
ncbi:MAG: hypothetical protein R2863_09540 [Candidatus Kapaibacterium sp.]